MDIGKRLKSIRTRNGLTLEELASRSELSKGFLSQLENNITSPSISTLEDITEVLGVSLEAFFKEDKEEQIRFNEDDYFVDEKDKSSITWLVPSAQKNEMEPILLELSEGGESNIIDPHEGEEFGYVLQGRIELVDLDNDRSTTIKKYETFYLKGEHRHKLVNNSRQNAELIWIITPPLF
ncbi:MAG: helix-turn-helix domain-containing protein [Erysipelotrichaceae bacterium]|nr:helix-turn-helix domain-containing protein [Erysipelotrichaceae bacterium]